MGINLSSLILLLYIVNICSTAGLMTVDDLNEKLMHWTAKYPNFVSIYYIGKSVEKKPIYVLKLGANSSEGVPNVKIIGTLHGNQHGGLHIIWKLADYLINGFVKSDINISDLLEKVNVHLLPVMNPDRYQNFVDKARKKYSDNDYNLCEIQGEPRSNFEKNNNNVSLNRNFPSKTYSKVITGIVQPETEAVINWMQTHFMLSAAIFSGNAVVSYPYASHKINGFHDYKDDSSESKTDDNDELKHLAHVYAGKQETLSENYKCHKATTFADNIINSASLYSTIGTMQDYNYDFHGCLEVSIYIPCCKNYYYNRGYNHYGHYSEIWLPNRDALLTFINESQRGVKGIIFNNGIPVAGASVTILGRNVIHKTTERGEYWRYLLPGSYQIQVEYKRKRIVKGIEILEQENLEPLVLNIDMNEATNEESTTELSSIALSTIEDTIASTPDKITSVEITTQDLKSDYQSIAENYGSKINISYILAFTYLISLCIQL